MIRTPVYISSVLHCVSEKKTSPFYFCDNSVRRHPILPILVRHIYPREFKTNTLHSEPQFCVIVGTVPCKNWKLLLRHTIRYQIYDIALPGGTPRTSKLRGVTYHMGSRCYLPPDTSERAPHNFSHAGWYSIYLPRRDGRLS